MYIYCLSINICYVCFLIQNLAIMSKSNKWIFTGLRIVAWLIFVGLSIEAGALIVNFIVSIYNPAFVKNLYQKLDLSEMYARSSWAFFTMYSFVLAVSILKAVLFYLVILLVTKMNLSAPFNDYVAKKIAQISYYSFSVGLVSYIAQQSAENLMQRGINTEILNQYWGDTEAFILMAAVVYVIATIFKRGIDLQNENDLTV